MSAALLYPMEYAGHRLIHAAGTFRRILPRPIRYLVGHPGRLLIIVWIIGILTVGCAQIAMADDGGLFGHPAYADAQKTLFEAHNPFAYQLTAAPSDGVLGVLNTASVYIINFIETLLMWIGLGLLYGALLLLSWFLNLNLYSDTSSEIDTAVQTIANGVFWPLFTASLAVGATIIFARWKGEGTGFLTDLAWMITAATMALIFIAQPSKIISEVDGIRQNVAAKFTTASTQYTQGDNGVTGYVRPKLTGPPGEVSARYLVDGLWDSFGATTWCLDEFGDLNTCKLQGKSVLADDSDWEKRKKILQLGLYAAPGDRYLAGYDIARLGNVLIGDMITIPMAAMILILTFSGLTIVVGMLLMLILGVLLLIGVPIPGWFRSTSTKFWIYILGMELQALFITAVLTGVMVVSNILGHHIGQYGYFIVAILNMALMFAGLKARAWLDMLLSTGGLVGS